MAEQAVIRLRSDAEIGVTTLVTTLMTRAVFQIARSLGNAVAQAAEGLGEAAAASLGNAVSQGASTAMGVFNVVSTVVTGVVDVVNAKYETSLNQFNNYEPWDLPFKTEGEENAAIEVQKWFGAEKGRRTPKTSAPPKLNNAAPERNFLDMVKSAITPKVVMVAGGALVLAGLVWLFIKSRKNA